jgi:hypothetical protein
MAANTEAVRFVDNCPQMEICARPQTVLRLHMSINYL